MKSELTQPITNPDLLREELTWCKHNIQYLTHETDIVYQAYAAKKAALLAFTARFKAADKALALLERKVSLPTGSGGGQAISTKLSSVPDELLALFEDPAKLARFKELINAQLSNEAITPEANTED